MTLFAKLAADAIVDDQEEEKPAKKRNWGTIMAAALGAGALGYAGYKGWQHRGDVAGWLGDKPKTDLVGSGITAGVLGGAATPLVTKRGLGFEGERFMRRPGTASDISNLSTLPSATNVRSKPLEDLGASNKIQHGAQEKAHSDKITATNKLFDQELGRAADAVPDPTDPSKLMSPKAPGFAKARAQREAQLRNDWLDPQGEMIQGRVPASLAGQQRVANPATLPLSQPEVANYLQRSTGGGTSTELGKVFANTPKNTWANNSVYQLPGSKSHAERVANALESHPNQTGAFDPAERIHSTAPELAHALRSTQIPRVRTGGQQIAHGMGRAALGGLAGGLAGGAAKWMGLGAQE